MKILMVSIFAPHFFNWTEQLKDSGHEVYWLDVFDSNTTVKKLDFVHQIVGWRYKWNYPGRYFIKKKLPILNTVINRINEKSFEQKLELEITKIQPDAIHFFVMYLTGVRFIKLMQKFPEIKWIYSAWGSDMFYYSKIPAERKKMKNVLPLVNYMFADCFRDYLISTQNGFKGKFFGPFPGGGGLEIEKINTYSRPITERDSILIKGYQGLHGKCISVLKAVLAIKDIIRPYKVVVFGASIEVLEFWNQNKSGCIDLQVLETIPHDSVLELMGKSLIYIGNSSSDGVPNTLLEAIAAGAFPIQSNPGGASSEWVVDKKNGLLISDPENSDEIKGLIEYAVCNSELIKEAYFYNQENIKPKLGREVIREEVLKCYDKIESD